MQIWKDGLTFHEVVIFRDLFSRTSCFDLAQEHINERRRVFMYISLCESASAH